LFAGASIARHAGVPWIAEFRDRWSEDPYSTNPPWRIALERRAENRLLRDVSALVTVSEPWARDYRDRLSVPILSVLNGFDPDEFPAEYDRGEPDPARLRIVYTGIL